MNFAEPSCRWTNWRLLLTEYEFQIKYKKSSENSHANALSLRLTGGANASNNPEDIHVFAKESETVMYSENDYPEREEEFIEDDYNKVDHILAVR